MFKKIVVHKYLFIALLLNFLVLLLYGFKHNFILTIYGDSFEQIFKVFYGSYDNIKNFNIKIWDFNTIYGMNYFSSNAWYGIFSPFFYLSIFLSPRKEYLIYTIYFMHIIKISLFLIFTYMWIESVYKDKLSAVIASSSIAYSSYFLTSIYGAAFLDVYIYVPLLLYFIEKFFKNKKTFSITFIVFIIALDNFYYLYIFIPFVCLYTLVRYLTLNEFIFKNFIKDVFKFIIAIFLGIMLSSFVLLPIYETIKETGRTDFKFNFNFIGIKNLYRYITSFFINIGDWKDNHNYFISTKYHGGISYGGGFSNFSSYFFIYCYVVFLLSKFKKEKITPLLLTIIYHIFALCFFSYYIFNLSLETRWLINIMWINCLVVGYVIKNIKEIKKTTCTISFIIISFLLSTFLFVSLKMKFTVAFWEINILFRNFIVALVLFICYFVLLYKKKFLVFLLVLLSFEGFFQFYNLFYNIDNNAPISKKDYQNFLAKSEVFDFLKKYDDSFYRINYIDYSDYYVNDPIAFNYNGFSFYHSIFDSKQKYLLNNTFYYGATLSFKTNDKQLLKNRLSSKYLVTKQKDIKLYGYSFLKNINDYNIYVNNYPFSFAYANTNLVNSKDFNKLYNHQKDYYLIKNTHSLTFNKNLILEDVFFEVKEKDGLYNLNEDEIIYVICPYGAGTYLKNDIFILDDQKNKIKKLDSQLSFYKDIFVSSKDKFLQNNNDDFIIEKLNIKEYHKKYEELKPYFVQNVKWGNDFIQGDIKVDKKDFVTTSVAYSDNFKLYVDGVRKDFIMVNDGLIGFEIDEGKHNFILKYEVKGLKKGLILSFIALIILVLKKCYLIIKK